LGDGRAQSAGIGLEGPLLQDVFAVVIVKHQQGTLLISAPVGYLKEILGQFNPLYLYDVQILALQDGTQCRPELDRG
jgi:hypothetical protein